MPSRDFTRKREPVWFTLDDQRYDCYPALPLEDLQAFAAAMSDGVTALNVVEKINDIMRLTLKPASYEVFVVRMADRNDPLDVQQLFEIAEWLVETYTKRPTAQPSSSSNGSPSGDAGSSSTAGAPETVSIHTTLTRSDSPI